ncbi:MAG TPA: bifunctional UDP-N-acetylglucosamine diphosphorylase/glucosamine-1-phosphate N-acetyltransferase GlmU, partial [Peptococcaceae bacterium]|nr:bifunctional UDP-N-acetylglucosamine diphosphorylase/glucosamine-1-phosphate N-acetyltransferase GlmU [Peptococcaceae bacterium]
PATTYIDKGVRVGRDTVIYPFTFLEGKTEVGPRCTLGPGARLIDARLGEGVAVQFSVVVDTTIGDHSQIGPYAYLRPGNQLADHVKVGDFVELKKATVGSRSKIPHLSYVGDTIVGEGVNIGAGTITCNYDGVKKYQTVIEDGVFVGSNTNLVAPVRVGKDAVIGAGSTITKDVPSGSLALERNKQTVIPDWKEKKKRKGD